jgi:hypothetical protein
MLPMKNLTSTRFTGEMWTRRNFMATKFIPQMAATQRSRMSDFLSFSTAED